jgi:hypothetical protein
MKRQQKNITPGPFQDTHFPTLDEALEDDFFVMNLMIVLEKAHAHALKRASEQKQNAPQQSASKRKAQKHEAKAA